MNYTGLKFSKKPEEITEKKSIMIGHLLIEGESEFFFSGYPLRATIEINPFRGSVWSIFKGYLSYMMHFHTHESEIKPSTTYLSDPEPLITRITPV